MIWSFSEFCASYGGQMCLRNGNKSWTYTETDVLSSCLAAQLGEQVCQKPVAIFISKGPEFYISQIAVLKAGGFFVPIDPNFPEARIDYMIENSEALTVLTIPGQRPKINNTNLRWLEVDLDQLAKGDTSKIGELPKVTEDDFAYMIYTSGSTGKPKGVPIHHAALVNHNRWFNEKFDLTPSDRVLQFASVSFDISIEEVFPTFLAGATLYTAPRKISESISNFFEWVEENKITVLNLPTAFWHELTYFLNDYQIPDSVRLLIIGGEKVSPDRVAHWFASQETKRTIPLYNAYGPTETTITSSVARLLKDKPITIGSPITGLEYHVCDDQLNQLDVDQPGELVISGEGVAKGYWHSPKKTEQCFITLNDRPAYRTGDRVQRSADGQYQFLGRIDDQVKINGFRIEPGEVSEQLINHPNVSQAIVVPETTKEQTKLVGYYVSNQTLTGADLKTYLEQQLPYYMIPAQLVAVEQMPISEGGKIDIASLAQLNQNPNKQADSNQKNTCEAKLANLWAEVLSIKPQSISVADNFFELGGNSLKALRLVSRIKQVFDGVNIPIAALFEHSTLSTLAKFIETKLKSSPTENDVAPIVSSLRVASTNTPIFAIHGAGGSGLFFANVVSEETSSHPLHILESPILYSKNKIALEQPSIEAIAKEYAIEIKNILRTSGSKSIILSGYSFGGLVAFQAAKLLQENDYTIEKLILLDTANPQEIQPASLSQKITRVGKTALKPKQLVQKSAVSIPNRITKIRCSLFGIDDSIPKQRALGLFDFYCGIASRYQPSKYQGEIHLISSTEVECTYNMPNDHGWGKLVQEGKLSITKVPGDHLTMLNSRNLHQVSKAFGQILND